MRSFADTADLEEALAEIRARFYGGDLPAAVAAGRARLEAIDPESREAGAQSTRAHLLLWLVRCARRGDLLDAALADAAAGIVAARAAGDGPLECRIGAQHVHVLASLGQNEAALAEGYAVLRLAVDRADPQAQAACWLALGNVHWAMQQWHDGDAAYTAALTFARQAGDPEIAGLASNGLAAMADHHAAVARADGRDDDALAHARRSFSLLDDFAQSSQAIGDAYNAWIGRYNQACCLLGMGDHRAARERLDAQLLELGDEAGYRRQLILQVLGDVHMAEGRPDLTIACEIEALEIAERLRVPLLAMDACRSLVAALERRGDFQEALRRHRQFHELYVQLASNKAQAHARAMAVLYESEKTRTLAEAQRRRADVLASANSSLVEEKAALQRHSLEDALTGLANRRRFDDVLQPAAGASATNVDRALALIDVDHFKRVNDRCSHLVGDEVLRRLGELLRRCSRKQDLAARYGGEEFALILDAVDPPTAHATCERLRAAIEAEAWSALHPGLRVTVSIGVVHAAEPEVAGAAATMLAVADDRLYAAKRGGRNRVVGASG